MASGKTAENALRARIARTIRPVCLILASAALATGAAGCGSAAKKPTPPAEEERELTELRSQVKTLQAKVDSLQSQLSAATAKAEKAQAAANQAMGVKPAKPTGVVAHGAEGRGVPVEATEAAGDPEAGFAHDSAILSYRQAMILFQTRKYAEAILAFSSFLERYADHALAGSAQFHVGESYFRQKEYKLALQEYQRVLTSYDRSPHVPETLARMAEIEEGMKKGDDAAKHRQLLASLFPSSPAAALKPRSVEVPAAAPTSAATAASSEKSAPAPAPESAPAANTPAAPQANSQIDEPPATAPLPDETPAEGTQ
jgi:tol-pal system protein YbgF